MDFQVKRKECSTEALLIVIETILYENILKLNQWIVKYLLAYFFFHINTLKGNAKIPAVDLLSLDSRL